MNINIKNKVNKNTFSSVPNGDLFALEGNNELFFKDSKGRAFFIRDGREAMIFQNTKVRIVRNITVEFEE